MKKLLIFLMFISSLTIFSNDAGYSYRFYVNVQVNDLYFQGYIYHYSYNKYDTESQLKKYLINDLKERPIKLYRQIKTVCLGNNYDFSTREGFVDINLYKNISIKLIEVLEFFGIERLILLDEDEYNSIKNSKPNYINLIHESILFQENISIIVFSWKNKDKVDKVVKDVLDKLIALSNNIKKSKSYNSKMFFNYYEEKKKFFKKNDIIMFLTSSHL